MTAPRFDSTIHAATRLQLCAMLAEVDAIDFAAVREDLGISDSVLSKHVKVLADEGYVAVKTYKSGGRSRKRLAFTKIGAQAYAGHIAELKRLIG
ncbi:transcriptional regulator [Demequina sp.]|uniref:transcriptional regulator n=1 Tax=Demequina sp. TaxID=2050685 RepID=UPI0025C3141C|nr:transcriptional regulator [Demequina sp.]